jgi:hypothetical protein
MFICLLAICCLVTGLPKLSWAAAQPLSPQERAELSQLQQPALLSQSAGERVVVIERRRPRWGWGPRPGYGYSAAAVILAAVLVTVIVVATRPRY